MSPSSTVHGGQYDTKYVTYEYVLHAVFVTGTTAGDSLNQLVDRYAWDNAFFRGIAQNISLASR